jgi:hypothetical protein
MLRMVSEQPSPYLNLLGRHCEKLALKSCSKSSALAHALAQKNEHVNGAQLQSTIKLLCKM